MSNRTSIDFTYCTPSMALCLYDLQLLLNGVALKGKQGCSPAKKVRCTQPHQSFANPRTHSDSTATSSVRQAASASCNHCLFTMLTIVRKEQKQLGRGEGIKKSH